MIMRSENQNFDLNQYIKGILSGDRATLSRAITLRESTLPEHKLLSEKLLKSLIKHTGNSIRIGVTGIPGAGKSTFIDVFGSYLIEKFNKKVATLVWKFEEFYSAENYHQDFYQKNFIRYLTYKANCLRKMSLPLHISATDLDGMYVYRQKIGITDQNIVNF